MSSTIKQAITALKGRIADAYTAIVAKGGTLPATQDSANLPTAISSIPGKSKIYPVSMPNFYGNPQNLQEKLGEDLIDLQGRNMGTYGNQSTFRNCQNVKVIDLRNINGILGGWMNTWFYGCNNLEEIYLNGSCDVDNAGAIGFSTAFYGTPKLRVFRVGSWFTHAQSFNWNSSYYAGAMTRESIVDFFNDLGQQDSVNFPNDNTLTLGSAKLALLSDADKAIATSKGWTLA